MAFSVGIDTGSEMTVLYPGAIEAYAADGVFLPPRAKEGADPVAHSESIAAAIKEQFNLGEGADVVLECTGAEPCIQAGINVAKKGGTYVQAGMGKEVSLHSNRVLLFIC